MSLKDCSISIVQGPSKFDLMVSLFERSENHKFLEFKLADSKIIHDDARREEYLWIRCEVLGVERLGCGGYEEWQICLKIMPSSSRFFIRRGKYSTMTRKGELPLEKE
jgi:hypothetical protein